VDFAGILLGGPKPDDGVADVFAEIEAERKADWIATTPPDRQHV
jgi:hypothetical protein